MEVERHILARYNVRTDGVHGILKGPILES